MIKTKQMKQAEQSHQMKIAELSERSGLTRSSIHHYLNVGLLHEPQKAGLNLSLYDETHVARLLEIRRMREEGHSLGRIKEMLEMDGPPNASPDLSSSRDSETIAEKNREKKSVRTKREKILDVAIELFSQKGFENTKISDITDALRMGKGTFYIYFKTKEELFLECIDRLTTIIVPEEAWEEIRNEKDYRLRGYKRGAAFLNAFPSFRGILNLLRVALGGDDPKLAEKARETFKILSRPMVKDIRKAVADGIVRPDIDEECAGYLLLVLAEGLGYWQMIDSRYTTEEVMEQMQNILGTGFLSQQLRETASAQKQANRAKVKDRKGTTTRLNNVSIGQRHSLPGKMGEATVEIDLTKISTLCLNKDTPVLIAEAIMRDGQKVKAEVDGELTLSGEASFGRFDVPLGKVAQISFEH